MAARTVTTAIDRDQVEKIIADLEGIQKKRHGPGEWAYRKGIDLPHAARGHEHYLEYDAMILEMKIIRDQLPGKPAVKRKRIRSGTAKKGAVISGGGQPAPAMEVINV